MHCVKDSTFVTLFISYNHPVRLSTIFTNFAHEETEV